MNERIPPQAVEVEQSILGTMLVDRFSVDTVFGDLKPNDFYDPTNEIIFESMVALQMNGSPIDLLTVEQSLRDKNALQNVGEFYLSDLTTKTSSNVDELCKIVKAKSMLRNLISKTSDILEKAYSPSADVFKVLDEAQKSVFEVNEHQEDHLHEIGEVLNRVFSNINAIQEQGKPLGIKTGLDLDYLVGGFQDGKSYVIGARPSMGKTALVMTMLRRIALDGLSTGIISLETTNEDLGVRLISQTTKIPAEHLVSGRMSESELQVFVDGLNKLSRLGIYIDDSPSMTLQQLRTKCRVMVNKGVKIIFIDFLTLLSTDGRSMHEEVGKITKEIQRIAQELNVPIVCLAQLSRKVEDRTDKRPMMSDLRESGSIEENAHGILFLYRPEYYGATVDEQGNSTKNVAEIIVAKNKNGKTGIKAHYFDGPTMTFSNLEKKSEIF